MKPARVIEFILHIIASIGLALGIAAGILDAPVVEDNDNIRIYITLSVAWFLFAWIAKRKPVSEP